MSVAGAAHKNLQMISAARLRVTLVSVVALAAVAGAVAGPADGRLLAPAAAQEAGQRPSFVPGRVVVRLQESASPYAAASVSGVWVDGLSSNGRYATVSVPAGREEEYRRRLLEQPGIQLAELDPVRYPSFVPNDELYPRQWSLAMIQAPQAWDVTRGEGVTVAVLDTGVAYEDYREFQRAPDLQQTRFVFPHNAISGGAHADDDEGHGTHVTGTIAEDSDNGMGAAGIAPKAAVMPVKVCGSAGCPGSAIAEGIYWAVDHGARVINLSLGGPTVSAFERDALGDADRQGVVVVAAAGNGGYDYQGDAVLDYPAAIDSVVSAGAVRYDATRARYSNYGSGDQGSTLDLVAPGGDTHIDQNGDGFPDGILQTTFAFSCSDVPRDYAHFGYCYYQGTSMATAHVSGVVALLLSVYPHLTPAQVRSVLACSARDLGPPGQDPEYGAGLVQAYDALRDRDHDGIVDCLDGDVSFIQLSGDVDCDASVDSLDGFFILRDTAGITPAACISAGDVNCDGSVDAVDALLVLRFSARLPAIAGPACPPIGSPR